MDRYISKSVDSDSGLDFIINDRISKSSNCSQSNKDYIALLSEFKQKISHKLLKFNPLQVVDKYDQLINLIWLQYILGNKTQKEYIRILDAIGIKSDVSIE